MFEVKINLSSYSLLTYVIDPFQTSEIIKCYLFSTSYKKIELVYISMWNCGPNRLLNPIPAGSENDLVYEISIEPG